MVLLYRIYLKDFLRNCFIFKTNCLRILFIALFQQQRCLALLNKLTFFLFKIETNLIQTMNRMIHIRFVIQKINTPDSCIVCQINI